MDPSGRRLLRLPSAPPQRTDKSKKNAKIKSDIKEERRVDARLLPLI